VIIKTVEIQGVRCFAQPVRVELAKDGFNIIAGPNGSGKSTLLEGVRRGLLDVHTATGAADLSPHPLLRWRPSSFAALRIGFC
jgi:ABC-type cobalamin/Fe3+-siderophores transport system ATPase subunit